MATKTVTTKEELTAALKAASGGDVIELAPGDYGDVWVYNLNFSSEVIVRSQDPNDPAVFGSAKIQFSSNLTIDSVIVDFVPDAETYDHSSAVKIEDSSLVSIRNSVIEGGVAVAGTDPDAEAGSQGLNGIVGEPIGRGVTVSRSQDVTIENNDISMFFKGIVVAKVDGADILNNEVHDLRGSPLVGGDLSDILVEANYFHDIKPWNLGGDGDHADMIHFWVNSTQTDPNSDITIKDNFLEQGDGISIYGVFLESGTGSYENVVIDGNVLHNGESQGFVLAAVDGLTVTNNTLLQSSGGINDAPKISLIADTKNAVISNNIYKGIFGSAYEDAVANNIVLSDNLEINYDDTEAANYVGNLFVVSEHSLDSFENLRVIPGSLADGVGSPLTQFDTTPDELIAGFLVNSVEENGETLVFDASSLTFGPDGLVGDSNAEFSWNFGDGYKATGSLVQRTYTEPGRYTVSLTVKTSDGESSRATYEIGVAGDELVSFDSATGEFVSHGYGEVAAANYTIENTSDTNSGKAVVLGDTGVQARVTYGSFDDIFGADNFDLSFTFKSTDGAASSGEIFRIHGSLVASIDSDGHFVFAMSQAEGPTLTSIGTGPSLNDGNKHDVSIQYEGDRDLLTILIDGEMVGTLRPTSDLRDDYPRDITFGNPWGGTNFKGKLFDFSISSYNPDYEVYKGDAASINSLVEEDHTSLLKAGVDGLVLDIAELDNDETVLKDDATVVSSDAGPAISFDGEKDFARLGRQKDYEDVDTISVSVDFTRSADDNHQSKLFWSKDKIGIRLMGDDLVVRVNTVDEDFKTFQIEDIGVDDTELHNALVMVDAESDRMQVLLDGVLILDETSTDFDLSGDRGWKLSTQGKKTLDGEISDFRIDDDVAFVEQEETATDAGLLV